MLKYVLMTVHQEQLLEAVQQNIESHDRTGWALVSHNVLPHPIGAQHHFIWSKAD